MYSIKKDSQDVAIEIKLVTKIYDVYREKPTFVEKLLSKKDIDKFTALNNVCINIYKGQKVGIIGHNGSGKTTLLKIIAGITSPTKGTVRRFGKTISLIDLTAGFHPDLTGEENVYLNGLLIGMGKKELIEKYEDIVAFADIGSFINSPFYTYSDGMKLRLGFSVAIHANPDILVLDEGISAGDVNFQKKVGDRIERMFREDKTIIVVSHWLEYLEKHCDRFLLFENGNLVKDGDFGSVSEKYLEK